MRQPGSDLRSTFPILVALACLYSPEIIAQVDKLSALDARTTGGAAKSHVDDAFCSNAAQIRLPKMPSFDFYNSNRTIFRSTANSSHFRGRLTKQIAIQNWKTAFQGLIDNSNTQLLA
jgi:hypothetical protein